MAFCGVWPPIPGMWHGIQPDLGCCPHLVLPNISAGALFSHRLNRRLELTRRLGYKPHAGILYSTEAMPCAEFVFLAVR
eukprot:2520498-Lingulodinium_polyedra.AAC.1